MSKLLMLLCLAGALLAGPARADELLRAGLGVTPLPAPLGAPLGGYGGLLDRRATGLHDRPEVRALLLENGDLRLALVSVDLVIPRPELRTALERRIEDLQIDGLLLATTHTHSGPGGYIEGFLAERITSGRFDPALRDGLVDAAAAALEAARQDLRPVRAIAVESEVDLAVHRRVAGGPRETSLPVLALEPLDASASPIVVFAYGAHPTVFSPANHAYSADYVGAARAWLQGAGLRPLFLAGPMGDQRPESTLADPWPRDVSLQARQVEEIGRVLGEATQQALSAARSGDSGLAWIEREIELPELRLRRFCALWFAGPLVRPSIRALLSERVALQVYAIGPARLLAVPAEPGASVGAALRAQLAAAFPGSVRFVVAHANDWAGYVVTDEAYARGGYEACLSFRGASFGSWLVEAAGGVIDALAARSRR